MKYVKGIANITTMPKEVKLPTKRTSIMSRKTLSFLTDKGAPSVFHRAACVMSHSAVVSFRLADFGNVIKFVCDAFIHFTGWLTQIFYIYLDFNDRISFQGEHYVLF